MCIRDRSLGQLNLSILFLLRPNFAAYEHKVVHYGRFETCFFVRNSVSYVLPRVSRLGSSQIGFALLRVLAIFWWEVSRPVLFSREIVRVFLRCCHPRSRKKKKTSSFQLNNHCGRLDVCKSGVYGAGLNRNMDEASAYVRMWNRRMYVCGKRLQKGSTHRVSSNALQQRRTDGRRYARESWKGRRNEKGGKFVARLVTGRFTRSFA